MRPYLSLATIDRYEADMARRGVSDVARSRRGFLTAYRRAGGDPDRLSEYWQVRRDGFIARHMAQVRERGEPLFEDGGEPTRRHLALIAWAYSPAPDRLPRHNPERALTFTIHTTAGDLARAVFGCDVSEFNRGFYKGTSIPLRAVPPDAPVTVTGKTSLAAIEDGQGGWIADRFGPTLGARQIRRLIDAEKRHNPASAERTRPELWARIVREVTAGAQGGLPGQWSARKAQLATALYQKRGGGYIGPKSPDNALTGWTRERWRTKSGRPSLVTGERYLPEAAIEALSPQEYAATTRAKRAGLARGEQYTPQPERIAERVHSLRRNAGARAIARELVNHCGWLKADARAITGKKWRKSMASPRAALSPDAQRVLLRALDAEVDPDVALVLRLCLVLGLRIAEATMVDRSRVTPEGLRVFGKGSKWRTVPWSVDRGAKALAARLPAVATVTPGRAQRACTRLAAAHPELSALTPHVLRHTFATNALRCCMDPKALQAALGHDKFNTTLTYLHTLGDV